MADDQVLITAADLDAMTPDERARAFRSSIVTSLDDLPPEFRTQVETDARRLTAEVAARRV